MPLLGTCASGSAKSCVDATSDCRDLVFGSGRHVSHLIGRARKVRTQVLSLHAVAVAVAASWSASGVYAQDSSIPDVELSGDLSADVVTVVPGEIYVGESEDCGCLEFVHDADLVEIADYATGVVHATIASTMPSDRFGASVAASGDLNLDGYPDLIVGAPLHDVFGAVFVFLGPFGGGEVRTSDDADLVIHSPGTLFDDFGQRVAFLADIDGDGLGEIRIESGVLASGGPSTMTHVYSSSHGARLATIDPDLVAGTWSPIEGDLDDNGQIDIVDVASMANQIGRTESDGLVWADLTADNEVNAGDVATQLGSYGDSGIVAIASLAFSAFAAEDCAGEECYFDGGGSLASLTGTGNQTVQQCLEDRPTTALADLTGCPSMDVCLIAWDDIFDDFYSQFPSCRPEIVYKDCGDCVSENTRGLYDRVANKIYICTDRFAGYPCECIYGTILEERLHALQWCVWKLNPPFSFEQACGGAQFNCQVSFCQEAQAALLFDCPATPPGNPNLFDEGRCECALRNSVGTLERLAAQVKLTDPACGTAMEQCANSQGSALALVTDPSYTTPPFNSYCDFLQGSCDDVIPFGDLDGDGEDEGLEEFPRCFEYITQGLDCDPPDPGGGTGNGRHR